LFIVAVLAAEAVSVVVVAVFVFADLKSFSTTFY